MAREGNGNGGGIELTKEIAKEYLPLRSSRACSWRMPNSEAERLKKAGRMSRSTITGRRQGEQAQAGQCAVIAWLFLGIFVGEHTIDDRWPHVSDPDGS